MNQLDIDQLKGAFTCADVAVSKIRDQMDMTYGSGSKHNIDNVIANLQTALRSMFAVRANNLKMLDKQRGIDPSR